MKATIQLSPRATLTVPQGWTTVGEIAQQSPGAYNRLMAAIEPTEGNICTPPDFSTRVFVRYSHLDFFDFCIQ